MKSRVVVVQMAQQHAELSAPITNVVDAKDVVPTTKKNHVVRKNQNNVVEK